MLNLHPFDKSSDTFTTKKMLKTIEKKSILIHHEDMHWLNQSPKLTSNNSKICIEMNTSCHIVHQTLDQFKDINELMHLRRKLDHAH